MLAASKGIVKNGVERGALKLGFFFLLTIIGVFLVVLVVFLEGCSS